MTAYVGIDLAWNNHATTGLAVVDADGALIASGSARSDAEIDSWLDEHCEHGVDVVAVDAPLIVTNPTGQRPCESLVSAAYGRYDAGCHSSNTGLAYMSPPRATQLALRQGWSTDSVSETLPPGLCIEVYPHAAMVGLFDLGRILKYKKGPVTTRRPALIEVLRLMKSLPPLRLSGNQRWHQIETGVAAATRPRDLDAVEDEVDAILCAHLAWLWHTDRAALHVFGDVATGYIVAPPAPTHAPTPRAAKALEPIASASLQPAAVTFYVDAVPATFATAGEKSWRVAVSSAAATAMGGGPALVGRLRVEVDFVTTPSAAGHPGWDLDNLIKPTIDALLPVVGRRAGLWRPEQVDDERVDEIVARKRPARTGETAGARITVTVIPDPAR